MGSAKMWMSAAAESCSKVSKMWQRGGAYSPTTPNSSRPAKVSVEVIGQEHCNPTICHIAMIFLSVTMFTSTMILLQSLRNSQAACFIPRFSTWTSLQPDQEIRAKITEMKDSAMANDKAWLLKQSQQNGTTSCHQDRTAQSLLFGIDRPARGKGNIRLQASQDHEVLLVSYAEDGTRRCAGGDFYETDLSGPEWKSRPPVRDLGDGSYLLNLRVESRFAGSYVFRVVLLFSNLHGLDQQPAAWAQRKTVVQLRIEFVDAVKPSLLKSQLRLCTREDFKLRNWRGRWTRAKSNESCTNDDQGRFKCLDPNEQCETPWCEGPVGSLESNGWVYSAHCAFRIFTQQQAWSCLEGQWLFFWGDSNHQDTIRNLLNFVLGRQESNLDRIFESSFSNPLNSSQALKITSWFNGHYHEFGNNLGLRSLNSSDYRKSLRSYFLPTNQAVPNTMILNSGLHDGNFWANLTQFAAGARNASSFWGSVWRNSNPNASRRPRLLYRTTVTPAGDSRNMPANPQKMEVYNTVLVETLVSEFGQDTMHIVDDYDMTFPWHYDNKYSDGGHYGRSPSLNSWLGPHTAHHYFVDVMLAHVLLNSICPL